MAVSDIITKIDEQILALLQDTDYITSYRMGNKSVSKTEALEALRKLRLSYEELAVAEPYEDIRHVAYDVDELGVVSQELVGDDS